MKKYLFVCGKNRWRSPTAEQIFSSMPNLEVASAGTNNDAELPVSTELIEWADMVFVMEKVHRTKLQRRFRTALKSKKLVCLDIPDNYQFMDPELIHILKKRMNRYLPVETSTQ